MRLFLLVIWKDSNLISHICLNLSISQLQKKSIHAGWISYHIPILTTFHQMQNYLRNLNLHHHRRNVGHRKLATGNSNQLLSWFHTSYYRLLLINFYHSMIICFLHCKGWQCSLSHIQWIKIDVLPCIHPIGLQMPSCNPLTLDLLKDKIVWRPAIEGILYSFHS